MKARTACRFVSSVAAVALLPFAALATTYYVNGTTGSDSYDGLAAVWNGTHGPKKAIVAGVNAAGSNDTVSIAAGVYSGASNIAVSVGKPLVIQSESGSDATIVDCNQQGRALSVTTGPTTIRGIKFTNGFIDLGAMDINGTTTQLVNVADCSFVSNRSLAVRCLGVPTVFSNCYFVANTNGIYAGAAIAASYKSIDPFTAAIGSLTVKGCTFSNNMAAPAGLGGAIYGRNMPVVASDCRFVFNSANYGGACYFEQYDTPNATGSNVRVSNCVFTSNAATNGGAVSYSISSYRVSIEGCVFSLNTAYRCGVIDEYDGGNSSILNSTFVSNQAAINSVIGSSGGYTPQGAITNSIVWNNPSGDGTPLWFGGSINYSDIQGGWTGAGTNNINADPLFVDTANGDYHLKSQGGHWTINGWVTDSVTSPCIDAGNPASDYSNEPTPNGGRVNIGYYGNTPQASKSPPPQITSIVLTNLTDLLLTWKTTGSSNIVLIQVCPGDASGGYSTNGFTDLTNLVVTTATTNFWDVGAVTNGPSRYYRMRLVP